MSKQIKNARVVYDFDCPVCHKSLFLQNFDNISGKRNRHLTTNNCLRCETRLSIDYNKAANMVVATIKESHRE